ncbi:hypothetical protein [Thermocrinis minervae]|uniref:Uncharacterized protein n=1 Tax=Thermocrinis minervae TaxID=381751 RepID=A0A1M6QVL5_9AQUI|nr:hypothetical protein [Thermocrinis minervae]SHK24245.1 hypothetical protein SAMN05444391_0415 [Thermocrinis minervae]
METFLAWLFFFLKLLIVLVVLGIPLFILIALISNFIYRKVFKD